MTKTGKSRSLPWALKFHTNISWNPDELNLVHFNSVKTICFSIEEITQPNLYTWSFKGKSLTTKELVPDVTLELLCLKPAIVWWQKVKYVDGGHSVQLKYLCRSQPRIWQGTSSARLDHSRRGIEKSPRHKRGVVFIQAGFVPLFSYRLNHVLGQFLIGLSRFWKYSAISVCLFVFIDFQPPWFPFWSLVIHQLCYQPLGLHIPVGWFENELGHFRADDSRNLLPDRIQIKSVMEVKGNLSLSSLISRINAPEFL